MAQAESPLVDFAKNVYNKIKPSEKETSKPDPAWHAKAVNEANESFAKKAQEPAKTTGKRKVGGAAKDRTMAKRVPPKGGPRKVATKQYGY